MWHNKNKNYTKEHTLTPHSHIYIVHTSDQN